MSRAELVEGITARNGQVVSVKTEIDRLEIKAGIASPRWIGCPLPLDHAPPPPGPKPTRNSVTEAGVDAVLERAGFSPGMLAKMWSETKVAAFNDLTGHEEAAQALDYPEAMGDYEELRTPKGTPYLRRRATVSAPAEMPY